MSSEQREIADGTLVVRSQESDGSLVIAFAGELDLANAGTAESALEGSLADASTPVIVDMREARVHRLDRDCLARLDSEPQ